MTIRSISNSESMDTIWDELVYTEARLLISPPARGEAKAFTSLLGDWEKVAAGQLQVWRAELVAQAQVDAEDDGLDGVVTDVDDGLQQVVQRDRSDARYTLYFKHPRNEVTRQALGRELDTVRQWPKSLAGESEPALQALGRKLAAQIASGDAAIAARDTAATTRAAHRVRDINPFIAAVNAARQAAYGALVIIGQKEGMPKKWAEGFFRKTRTSRTPAATNDTAAAG